MLESIEREMKSRIPIGWNISLWRICEANLNTDDLCNNWISLFIYPDSADTIRELGEALIAAAKEV